MSLRNRRHSSEERSRTPAVIAGTSRFFHLVLLREGGQLAASRTDLSESQRD